MFVGLTQSFSGEESGMRSTRDARVTHATEIMRNKNHVIRINFSHIPLWVATHPDSTLSSNNFEVHGLNLATK